MATHNPENIDPEKAVTAAPIHDTDTTTATEPVYDNAPHRSWKTRFVDSFKRDPNAAVITGKAAENMTVGVPSAGAGGPSHKTGFDHAGAAARTANSGLNRKLKSRHLQMIAIGGSIGEFRLLSHLQFNPDFMGAIRDFEIGACGDFEMF